MPSITYRSSGVDIQAGNEFVKKIKAEVRKAPSKGVLSEIGEFGGLFDISTLKMKKPVFVSSADGVGTKLLLAVEMEKYDTIGIDAVAMNVNDILTTGAMPLFFLDYLAVGKLDIDICSKIIRGIAKGCRISQCAILGGETAEMPGIYKSDDFDLAGFCVGVVEKDKIITGDKIREGDMVFGIKSSGFHSNGFSLIREVLKSKRLKLDKVYKGFKRQLGYILLEPTRIYVKPVLSLLEKITPSGMAHITGGGLRDKLGRIIPEGLCAKINRNAWRLPQIFKFMQKNGSISDDELYSVFNCGVGFVVIVHQKDERAVKDHFGNDAVEIGYVEKNDETSVQII